MNSTTYYSLEFASNGSKYIVFKKSLNDVSNYAINDKIMIDYWSYYTFAEGFDYEIVEDPLDSYVSIIDWVYKITDIDSYTMHPDFVINTSFSVGFSALEWDDIDEDYVHDGVDEFVFQTHIDTNTTVLYSGDATEDFSVLNVVPDNQFDKPDLFERIYVYIWDGEDESTVFIYEYLSQPIGHGYIVQDENCSFYFTLNYTKIEQAFQQYYPEYVLLDDSYAYVHLSFESTQLRYSISNTPFNYDYVGSEHATYHIKLTIEGKAPIYSYQPEFNDYVLKIENNYMYFNDSRFIDDGYIANNSLIELEYKYKLQPGLLERKHFLAVIYPWSNVFNSIVATRFMAIQI
jgi:hypothetical protein